MTFDRFDTVVVPFPFTDRRTTKRRPALMLSDRAFGEATDNALLAMITSAEQSDWPGDTALSDRARAGLPKPCKVRMKLFTLDHRLIERRIGTLSQADRDAVVRALRTVVGL
ncbi:type II toxin-antitoxin system PemK/MazF family toxin [Rhizorhabdus wittichii]|uniref:type II toxin-antitoxin system PemK/MazF family toxin n=1 Tax=Rhizorhabdus wittichii TaxID=160791 RepID=UPI000309F0BF|nr:type II toxin-antitoxin system PemK/MazF family toxin [Rhizorhabdus wittichii]